MTSFFNYWWINKPHKSLIPFYFLMIRKQIYISLRNISVISCLINSRSFRWASAIMHRLKWQVSLTSVIWICEHYVSGKWRVLMYNINGINVLITMVDYFAQQNFGSYSKSWVSNLMNFLNTRNLNARKNICEGKQHIISCKHYAKM